MKDVPMRLMVRDDPAPVSSVVPAWAAGVMAVAGLVAVFAVGLALWRWWRRPRDPYERLLARLTRTLRLSAGDRAELMMVCGGEPRRAVGALMAGVAAAPGRGGGSGRGKGGVRRGEGGPRRARVAGRR